MSIRKNSACIYNFQLSKYGNLCLSLQKYKFFVKHDEVCTSNTSEILWSNLNNNYMTSSYTSATVRNNFPVGQYPTKSLDCRILEEPIQVTQKAA